MTQFKPHRHSSDADFERLRIEAEKLLRRQGAARDTPDHDFLKLIHELNVHQVELELQNEELKHGSLYVGKYGY